MIHVDDPCEISAGGLLQDDVDNMVRVGFDAYRFSISWSRIFPSMC